MSLKNKVSIPFKRFVGVSLSGGKANKSSLVAIEYYPEQRKIFLTDLMSKIKNDEKSSADKKIVEHLNQTNYPMQSITWDVPLGLPKCFRCQLKCPGYEICEESEIDWLRRSYLKKFEQKKPKKSITPYTERCVEFFVSNHLGEKFQMGHALGANLAPLVARSQYLIRQITFKKHFEIYAPLSLWRIGRSLGLQKSYLRNYHHSIDGEDIRRIILEKISEESHVFFYYQDLKVLIKDFQAFDAFIGALSGLFHDQKKSEPRPKGFPSDENWLLIPKEECWDLG